TLAYQSVTTVVQSAVVLGAAYLAGARFTWAGVLGTTGAAVLLTLVFAALSDAVALLVRQQEALIGISQVVALPLVFLSSAVMDTRLAPTWIQEVARWNPLDWTVVASRELVLGTPDWSVVWPRVAG